MRFGLVGTGHWARVTHAPGVAAAEGAQLVGVWGRRPDATAALAEAAGITAYDDYAAMLDDVDAVAFAVPPDVQTQTALAAARAGKHLLLDKPVALDSARAAELAGVIAQAGVAALVFFTSRFQTAVRDWVDEVGARSWEGGTATWLGSAFAPGSPYAGSSWRRERGGLWDVTPHALSVLVPALGPVTHVSAAERGVRDTRHLVLHHESGATSTVTVGIDAAEAAAFNEAVVWGQPGRRPMPWGDDEPDVCLRRATEELLAAATGPTREHPCDLRLGTHVVEVIEAAERVLAGGPAPEGEVRRVHRE